MEVPSQKWEVNAFSHLRIGITVFGVHQHVLLVLTRRRGLERTTYPPYEKKLHCSLWRGQSQWKIQINTNGVRDKIENLTSGVGNALFPHWSESSDLLIYSFQVRPKFSNQSPDCPAWWQGGDQRRVSRKEVSLTSNYSRKIDWEHFCSRKYSHDFK